MENLVSELKTTSPWRIGIKPCFKSSWICSKLWQTASKIIRKKTKSKRDQPEFLISQEQKGEHKATLFPLHIKLSEIIFASLVTDWRTRVTPLFSFWQVRMSKNYYGSNTFTSCWEAWKWPKDPAPSREELELILNWETRNKKKMSHHEQVLFPFLGSMY